MNAQLGDYFLKVDFERTKQTYLEIEKGGAECCGCLYCRNFLAALPEALPREVLRFFEITGINPKKDAEVYEMGEVSPGVRLYGGEYYLFGSIISDPNTDQVLGKCFRFAFMQPSPLAQDQFRHEGALCFYFTTEIPWVLKYEIP